jgi:4-hydroxy-tetrahydrodipicolinate synthase
MPADTRTADHRSRRSFLSLACASALSAGRVNNAAETKPLRGVFVIMGTPYTEANAIDYEDLAGQVGFLHRCGVHGMVWPQLASEYSRLTVDERMRGMEVLAKAIQGKKPALVLGVQGPNTDAALEYTKHAERLAPDALIAIPPTEAKSLDDFRTYYTAIAKATRRPVFIQTIGGAKIGMPVDFIVSLAREFPHLGHVKEEDRPAIPRMTGLLAHRPAIRSLMSGTAGRGMMYEMRLGSDGTMPGAPLADVYAQIWDLYRAGDRKRAQDLFSKLLLMINTNDQIPGTIRYLFQKRGVFKTTVSRQPGGTLSPAAIEEIDFHFEALKPFLRVS